MPFDLCPLTWLFLPAIGHDRPDPSHTTGAPADDILGARRCLLEQAAVLERFAEDNAEHRAMARVSHGRDLIAPLVDERAQPRLILGETAFDA